MIQELTEVDEKNRSIRMKEREARLTRESEEKRMEREHFEKIESLR